MSLVSVPENFLVSSSSSSQYSVTFIGLISAILTPSTDVHCETESAGVAHVILELEIFLSSVSGVTDM